jgi:hypothetical protein
MKGEFETHNMFMNQIFFTINLKEGEKEDNSNLVNKLVRSC